MSAASALTWACHKNMTFEQQILELHREAVASGELLRNLAKRKVSRVRLENASYVVKAYRRNILHRIFHIKPHSIAGSVALKGYTPPVLSDFIAGGWQVNVYPDIGGPDLYDGVALSSARIDEAAAFSEAGALLAKIHARGIFHADAKAPNFVLNRTLEALPPVLIIDCDRVKVYDALPMEKRAFNLAQFLACYVQFDEHLVSLLETALISYQREAGMPADGFRDLLASAFVTMESDRHVERRIDEDIVARLKQRLELV